MSSDQTLSESAWIITKAIAICIIISIPIGFLFSILRLSYGFGENIIRIGKLSAILLAVGWVINTDKKSRSKAFWIIGISAIYFLYRDMHNTSEENMALRSELRKYQSDIITNKAIENYRRDSIPLDDTDEDAHGWP